MSVINQQNLKKSQSALATSMERLSSGLRINNAKDDAAGRYFCTGTGQPDPTERSFSAGLIG